MIQMPYVYFLKKLWAWQVFDLCHFVAVIRLLHQRRSLLEDHNYLLLIWSGSHQELCLFYLFLGGVSFCYFVVSARIYECSLHCSVDLVKLQVNRQISYIFLIFTKLMVLLLYDKTNRPMLIFNSILELLIYFLRRFQIIIKLASVYFN